MQSYIVSKKVVVSDFKRVDKRKKLAGQHDSDSDFKDEISAPKRKKSKIKISENARVTRSKVNASVGKVDDKKSDKKKSRNVFKVPYLCYVIYFCALLCVCVISRALSRGSFGNSLSTSSEVELLRSLLLAKTDNDRDDLFIFNINGKDLHFKKREFSVVSGLKCFKKSDFVSDPKVRNKLMDRYYPGMDKVMRFVFYDDFDFVNKKIAFRDEDLYEIGLVYFIGRFLHSELPRTFIKKADFDLVESSHYLKYDWGEELKFNLGAIHQDSLGHEHRNDLDHSILPITEDAFSVLKNEIANVCHHMSLFQEEVDSQFNGMREFVEEFVKLILNELRFVKQQSSEFIEKENKIIPEFVLADIKIGEKDWFRTLIHTGRSWNDENVLDHVRSLSTMIPLFLVATNFFGKRSDIDWHRKTAYIDKSLSESLKRKKNDGAVSESEATENVTSKYGGFKRSREQFGSSTTR
ncbi:hypothetical protein BC332_27727 [Capsicum chinense]|nr:hypothetical protein BC332_27727 [Capsicum chinense]